jgi:rare lipoprotein A
MTLLEIVPALLLSPKQPDRTSPLAALVLSALATLLACDAQAADKRASSIKTAAGAEAQGGNPQFYDVFGKRYRVRSSSEGYDERGIASWYGRPFHGRPTSSGEMYDMNEMTAAHTSLPLPTWVEVTNLTNGKRIVVKVNDRGPFVGKRLIDLSYAAATALDIVRDGTARVEVRALSGPPPATTAGKRNQAATATATATLPNERAKTAKSVAKPPPDSSLRAAVDTPRPSPADTPASAGSERLFAQAGRFTKRDDAVQLVDSLKAQGFVNAFVVTEDGRRKSRHGVRVGPLVDAAEVERMSAELREVGAKRSRSVSMP